jgi:hypothetical protein
MSTTRYLEIDSTYRNRNEWPKAGEFGIPISQTGRKGAVDAVDPISNSAAEVTWVADAFNVITGGNTLSNAGANLIVTDLLPIAGAPVGAASGTVAFILSSIPGTMQLADNYYRAAVLVEVGTPTIKSRIVESQYLGIGTLGGRPADRMLVRVLTPLSLAVGTRVDINDPTDFLSFTDPLIFVPTGKVAPNAYPNKIIHNQTQEQWRPVAGYNLETHLLSPDTTGSAISTLSSGPTTTWTAKDTYSIRPAPTGWCGTLDILPAAPASSADTINTKRSFNLPITATNPGSNLVGSFLEVSYLRLPPIPIAFIPTPSASQMVLAATLTTSTHDDFYVGCQIRLSGVGAGVGQRRTITNYVGASRTITVTPAFNDTPSGAGITYQIICGGVQQPGDSTCCTQDSRRIVKYADYRDTALNAISGGTTISFPATASNLNGYYTDMYIRVDPASANNLRLITNYVVTRNAVGTVISRIATVDTAFTGLFSSSTPPFTITSGVVGDPFTFSLFDQHVCLLPFSNDNLNPFVYTGSLVSQQDVVCYEVELLNLVLPNSILAVSSGGFVAYYPYVYVQLMNVDSSGGHLKNIIYSNNPNATNMLFRAAIDDVPNPLNSTFIKIDSDGAVQTIKFKPNDNLLFSVRMPSGEIYETVEPEAYSPCVPNPKIQISALFSLKRL